MRLSSPIRQISTRAGMTLIEIMIVLSIIGAIAAILLPKMAGAGDKAKVKEARIMIGQVVNALSMYYTDCGKYPQSLDGLTKADSNCPNWGPEAYYKLGKGQDAIKDPWQNPFHYELKGSEFIVKSLGKDGADGGDGYNADISNEDL